MGRFAESASTKPDLAFIFVQCEVGVCPCINSEIYSSRGITKKKQLSHISPAVRPAGAKE